MILLCLFGSALRVATSGEAGREFLDRVLTLESFLGSWSLSTSRRSSDTHSSKRLLTDSIREDNVSYYMYVHITYNCNSGYRIPISLVSFFWKLSLPMLDQSRYTMITTQDVHVAEVLV